VKRRKLLHRVGERAGERGSGVAACLVANVKATYKARAIRYGRWWAIEVPQVPGVHSQARRLDQVEAMAREAIALLLDVAADSFDLVVEPDLGSLGDLRQSIEDALETRNAAERAQNRASSAMRHAVREIRSAGYTSRDAGKLLGVSNQRISQLERDSGRPQRPPNSGE
jgi:predicted RNase H-like HicB family nuclease